MAVTPTLLLRVFTSAIMLGGLLDMYILQVLKRYEWSFASEGYRQSNMRWARRVGVVRMVLGDHTIAFMQRRTLLFPLFELVFGVLVAIDLYVHGSNVVFVRDLLYLCFCLPLAVISWQEPKWSIAPSWITKSGTVVGIASGWLLGLTGFLDALLGAAVGFGVFLAFFWLGALVYRRTLGYGVVMSAMMMGSMVGFSLVIVSLVCGVLAGGVVAMIVLVVTGDRTKQVAYVPVIVLGGLTTIFMPYSPSDLVIKLASVFGQ